MSASERRRGAERRPHLPIHHPILIACGRSRIGDEKKKEGKHSYRRTQGAAAILLALEADALRPEIGLVAPRGPRTESAAFLGTLRYEQDLRRSATAVELQDSARLFSTRL